MSEAPLEWTTECPVTLDFCGETSKATLKNMWRLVPLWKLEALYVEGYHLCWDGFWADVLGRAARKLAYIHLRGTSELLGELIKSMRSKKNSVSRSVKGCSTQKPIFSPALSHLVLEYMEFDLFGSNWARPSDLLDVLIDRANEDRGLDQLTITACTGISARDVQLLREVVADVNWDEYEIPDDYDLEYDYDSLEDDGYSFYSGDYYGGLYY